MNKSQYDEFKIELLELQLAAAINYNNALQDALATFVLKADNLYIKRQQEHAAVSQSPDYRNPFFYDTAGVMPLSSVVSTAATERKSAEMQEGE